MLQMSNRDVKLLVPEVPVMSTSREGSLNSLLTQLHVLCVLLLYWERHKPVN